MEGDTSVEEAGSRMRIRLTGLGVIALILGFMLNFGFGILYSWPLLLIGTFLVLLGLVLPNPARPATKQLVHSCPTCGADLPDDATCPTCGKLP